MTLKSKSKNKSKNKRHYTTNTIKNTSINTFNKNKFIKNKELQIPLILLKYYNKHIKLNNKFFTFKWLFDINNETSLHKCNLVNKLNNTENVIKWHNLKRDFKTYYPHDYMNYIKYNDDEIEIDIENKRIIPLRTYDNKPIILEAYLMIIISNETFKSYMLDLVMMNIDGIIVKKQFPQDFDDTFENIYIITNKIFTLLKYISIILSNNAKLYFGCSAGYEIFKISIILDEEYNIKLKDCSSKTIWNNTIEDKHMYEWIDNLIFRPLISNKKSLHIGLSTQLLYELKYKEYNYKNYKPPIYAFQMDRVDFKNIYILFSTPYLKYRNFNVSFLQKSLSRYGLKQTDLFSSIGFNIAFMWYFCEFDFEDKYRIQLKIKHYNTLCYLSNMLDNITNIDEKNVLYNNFKKQFPNEYLKILSKSFILNKNDKYNEGDILIAKPLNYLSELNKNRKLAASRGEDMIIINSIEKMENAKQLLNKYDNILISKYIINPLLFKKKKFHLRLCFIISIINSKYNAYLLDIMRIFTSKLPFKLEDFNNKDIHDTHLKSTDKDYFFPQDFTTENMGQNITPEIINTLWDKIRDIIKKIVIIGYNDVNKICLYNNHKNGFHIFGPDIMIDIDLNPILLECNAYPAYYMLDKSNNYLYEHVFNLIDDVILQPTFEPDNINYKYKSSKMSTTSLYTRKY